MNRLLTFLILLISVHGFGQIKLTGQIVDLKNNPIPNANISVVGLTASGVTDESGVFFATLPTSVKKGDIITIRVSKEGYNTISKHIAATYLSIPIKLSKDLHSKKKAFVPSSSLADSKANTQSTGYSTLSSQPTTVTSYFQSGGITANQVNIVPLSRHLDEVSSNRLINSLPDKNEKINITCIWGDSEAFQFATQISDFLKANGYKRIDGVDQVAFTRPVIGQYIDRDTAGVKILIGARQ
jgi:hypothetical protein